MLSLPVLILIFSASAAAIWFAGIKLSETADILAIRFGFGEALAGMILLAIVTNLPEIAITVLIEEAGQGSDEAVPVAKAILQTYFERVE